MKVKFSPTNEEFEIQPNQTVLDLAQKSGVFIKTICNGNAACAECRVKIIEGDHNVLSPSAKEIAMIGSGYFIDQRRLACQLRCFGDVTIDLTEQEAKKKSGPKKVLGNRKMEDDSHAISAMILEEDQELVEQVEARAKKSEEQNQNKGPHKNKRKRNNRNRNRNRNNRNKSN